MGSWITKSVKVEEVKHDGDLNRFVVSDLEGNFLGHITPSDTETMLLIRDELNIGHCPIADAWEDGNGNTCNLEGWGGLLGEGDELRIEGHIGTWYVIDRSRFESKPIYLLEHETFGDEAAF